MVHMSLTTRLDANGTATNGVGRTVVSGGVFNTDGTTTESSATLAGSLCDQNLTNALRQRTLK